MDCDFVLYEIFAHFTIEDWPSIAAVSQLWYSTVTIDSLWKHYCIRDKNINYKANAMTWKEMYRVDLQLWKVCLHLCVPDEELESVAQSLVELRRDSNRTCIEETCDFPFNNLWMCMNRHCGYYGCGRRDNAHSKKHHEATKHPLHIKLNTLEIWCHSCGKWPGGYPQEDHVAEIERANDVRNKIVKFATKWDVLDEKSIERRKLERTLMESKEESERNKNIVYVVDDGWVKQWVRYVIGDSPPPSNPIDNSRFVLNQKVLNLFAFQNDYTYVKPIQWFYFKETYGASPSIKLIFDPETRNLKDYQIEYS